MKKLLIIGLSLLLAVGVNAQEAAEKKVLAGLMIGGGMNFNSAETNAISTAVGGDFVAGMNLDWHFAKNIALSTGIEFDFNRFTHSFDSTAYFDYQDKEVLQRGNCPDGQCEDQNLGNGHFLLKERKYKSIYLSIPVMLRFQTNYLGYIRYFGKFGIRNSFLLKSRGDNVGNQYPIGAAPIMDTELEDMRIPGSLSLYKGTIAFSAGAEWNFTGSTCLVGEIGYYYGFSEIHQQTALTGDDEKNMTLYNGSFTDKSDRAYFTPSSRQGQLLIKVSILF
jgi:hypothetical protein